MTEGRSFLPTLPALLAFVAQAPATDANTVPETQGASSPLLLLGGIALVLFVVVGIVLMARRK